MKRGLRGVFLAGAIAVGAGACDDRSMDDGYYPSSNVDCTRYTTCGTCTPVVGCGWCSPSLSGGAPPGSQATGMCASDPDYCTGKAFSWTWEPTGCRVAADASASGDAATEAAPSDAQASDAQADADAAPAR